MHKKDDLSVFVLELISRPGSEQDGIPLPHLQAAARTILQETTRTGSEDLSSLRLAFGAIRQNDSACRYFGRLLAPHDNSVAQRPDLHRSLPRLHASTTSQLEE